MSVLRWGTMSLTEERVPAEHGNAVFEALSSDRGRELLAELRHRSVPVSLEDLATALAESVETGQSDEQQVLIELTHTVLPKYEDAGLVERTDSGVATADHPALADPVIDRLLDADAGHVFEALSKRRRRIAVAALRNRSSTVDRRSLAATVAARERTVAVSDVDEETVSSVLTSLHHVHLPALADADLIEIDDGDVAYDGHPALDDGTAGVAYAPASGD